MERVKVSVDERPSGALSFLYKTRFGRVFLSILTRPFISKMAGFFLSKRISCFLIKSFIESNHIDMSDYPEVRYASFNDFFTRNIQKERRPIAMEENAFISPCDSKLSIYKINESSIFEIKESFYSIEHLLDSHELAKKYKDGYCLVFRLAVDDYHRYCYIDEGYKTKNVFIPGKLHTVQPMVLNHINIYKENSREYTICHTKHFKDVTYVEVGAMMVGKIKNHHQEYSFSKGEEKGYFEFGGSTVVLLVEKDTVVFDQELIDNTVQGFETKVKFGEKIGSMLD